MTESRRWYATGWLVLLASCSAIGHDEWPQVAERPRPTLAPTEFARALDAAESRYARGIECGTQYLFEMGDLARQADDHIPELVAAFRTGTAESEASTVLRLMQDRALLAVPALLELAGDLDPTVRNRGLAALDIAFDAASPKKATCGAG